MFTPCQLTLPSAGSSSPHRMRNKLVLPLPLGPVSCTKVPDDKEKSRPLKSLRSPRTHASLLTSSMGGSSSAPYCKLFGARLHGALCFHPLIPAALQDAHVREAALAQNLRSRNARLIFRTRTVEHDLAIARQILEWWKLRSIFQMPHLEVIRALHRRGAVGENFRRTNVDDQDRLIARHLRLQFFGGDGADGGLLRVRSGHAASQHKQDKNDASFGGSHYCVLLPP